MRNRPSRHSSDYIVRIKYIPIRSRIHVNKIGLRIHFLIAYYLYSFFQFIHFTLTYTNITYDGINEEICQPTKLNSCQMFVVEFVQDPPTFSLNMEHT